MQPYPKHYCGLFGIYGHPNAAELTYYGLYALQHRGQESAGIVACDGHQFRKHVGMGLVFQVFSGNILHGLVGDMAIGHTRYSTTGSSQLSNAQPMTVNSSKGQIAIAHNGNLTNAAELRDALESKGLPFQTTVDSEIILMLLAQPTLGGSENNLIQTVHRIEGAYSLVIMTEQELIGVRDPHGFRPLSIGRVDDCWVLASETCAFDLIHARFVRDVKPGAMSIRSAWKWAVNSRANIRSPPTSSCPCPTAATAPRSATRRSRKSRSRWPLCAIITSAAVFSSQRSSFETST